MSFDALLVHLADIQKRSPGVDRFGQPVETWVAKASDVRCRITAPRGQGLQMTDRSQGVVRADYMMYFLPSVDIGEADRITNVRGSDGSAMVSAKLIPMQVRPVSTRGGVRDHLEIPCTLYREQAGG